MKDGIDGAIIKEFFGLRTELYFYKKIIMKNTKKIQRDVDKT